MVFEITRQTQNICITFVQCWTVDVVQLMLYKCFVFALYLGFYVYLDHNAIKCDTNVFLVN